MKKNYFLVLSLISTFGFSQQVIKRITDTPSQTIVELFVIRNGTSLPNTTGNSNFNSGTSDNVGNVIVYNPNEGFTYSDSGVNLTFPVISDQILGNGTFVYNQTTGFTNTNFILTGGSGATLPLLIPQEDGNADSTQDSNNITDLLYSKWLLPKTLTNGNPIPTNLVAICISRIGKDVNTGGTSNPTKRLGFAFNGTTWIAQTNDPIGNAYDILQAIDVSGQLLTVNEFINNYRITIYPNPTNNFIKIQNSENSTEKYEYKIADLTGRIVKNGNPKFNEEINVENLQNGNYIIQIKNENGELINQKLIKK